MEEIRDSGCDEGETTSIETYYDHVSTGGHGRTPPQSSPTLIALVTKRRKLPIGRIPGQVLRFTRTKKHNVPHVEEGDKDCGRSSGGNPFT
mgnify:CR=1 FL=1